VEFGLELWLINGELWLMGKHGGCSQVHWCHFHFMVELRLDCY